MAREVVFTDVLTIGTVGEMADELMNAMRSGQEVTVNLSGVERIDCAALQVLVAAKKEAELSGVTMTCSIPDLIRGYAASVGVAL